MANTLVQSAGAQTSVNSPTSVTPTLGTASTAGNLLLMSVVATGTSPTITTPAGWTLLSSAGQSNIVGAIFSRPNNPGGITAVAVTVSATNGGACASIFEFAGVGVAPTLEYQISFTFTGSAGFGPAPQPAPQGLGEIILFVVGCVGGNAIAITSNPDNMSANTAGGSSTVATTNAQIANFISLASQTFDSQPAGTIAGGSQPIFNGEVRIITTSTTLITRGAQGTFVGQSLNPAGSLQTPQPIAPGSFFSGTSGSF